MDIPIENIYFLLCYAWNKLEEKNRVNVSTDGITKLSDLFAKILINGTKVLLKRGFDNNYIDITEELSGIKGKLEINETLKRNLLYRQRTICWYDEFSINILSNRILFSTINNLIKIEDLHKEIKKELLAIRKRLAGIGIEEIEINSTLFKNVKIHRNNNFYGFIMNVCQIIYENSLPSEEEGRFKFKNFTDDRRKMQNLFEKFILNFYRIEVKKIFPIVNASEINWNIINKSEFLKYFPKMKTDITLENDIQKIIIDAKFYPETLVLNQYGQKKIRASHLYQIYCYLVNQRNEKDNKTISASGILLYPTVYKESDSLEYQIDTHWIKIKQVNLRDDWQNITKRLKEIVGIAEPNSIFFSKSPSQN